MAGLYIQPTLGELGQIKDVLATYQPKSDAEILLYKRIRADYDSADQIRNYPFREFNYRSLWQQCDYLVDRFINFTEDQTQGDPDQSWRANTVRPLSRNKVLEIAAAVTQSIVYPKVDAENRDKMQDTKASMLMEDLMEWVLNRSKYDSEFLYSIIGMLVYPISYFYDAYAELERDFKVYSKNKKTWTVKKQIDEVYSGFISLYVPCLELYVGDAYEPDIQKQPYLMWRKVVSYEQAKTIFGDTQKYPNFTAVRPGYQNYFSVSDNSIYEQQADYSNADRVVEWVCYYNRLQDTEVNLINGICMDDPERPLQRTDKKYPFASQGFGIYTPRFFYKKSLVDDLIPDQDQADILINLILDGAYLRAMPPSITFGDEIVETNVMVPGMTTPLQADTKLQPIEMNNDVGTALSVLQNIEFNAAQSSKQTLVAQQEMTKYQASRIENEIQTKLGLFGKSIVDFVRQIGDLKLQTIVDNITVSEVAALSGHQAFADVVVHNRKDDEGNAVSRRIKFTNDNLEPMNDDELLMKSYELLAKEKDTRIVEVNPEWFRSLTYRVRVTADTLFRKSAIADRDEAVQFYQISAGNPFANQKEVYKAIAEKFFPGNAQRFVVEEQPAQAPMSPIGQEQMPAQVTKGMAPTNILA